MWNREVRTELVGVLLSLFFSCVPGLRAWFDRLVDRDGQGGAPPVMPSPVIFRLNCADAFEILGIDGRQSMFANRVDGGAEGLKGSSGDGERRCRNDT